MCRGCFIMDRWVFGRFEAGGQKALCRAELSASGLARLLAGRAPGWPPTGVMTKLERLLPRSRVGNGNRMAPAPALPPGPLADRIGLASREEARRDEDRMTKAQEEGARAPIGRRVWARRLTSFRRRMRRERTRTRLRPFLDRRQHFFGSFHFHRQHLSRHPRSRHPRSR